MSLIHILRALRAVAMREMAKFVQQRGRLLSALVRPLIWLAVFAAGFYNVFGASIIPPYKTYISHWVGFDPDKANGFHSFLKDKDGNVVDASTGRVSNGCIRTGEPDTVFAFAEIGMTVYVHS